MREGVELEEGQVVSLQTAVLDNAHRTLLYPDPKLLQRLTGKYGSLDRREDVTVLKDQHQLELFYDSLRLIFEEEGLELPV